MRKASHEILNTAPVTVSDVFHNSPGLQENTFMFMKNIRGTVAYFRNALYNLLAMFRSVGPPTLFVTLSTNDLHWPELGMMLNDLSYDDAVKEGSFFNSMRSDPLLTATHFQRRFDALLKYVINGPKKPLGKITDYFARVEFQNRGSPHMHIFFWVKGFPTEVTSQNKHHVLAYIENTIFAELPEIHEDVYLFNLVKKLHTHHHSHYCKKTHKSKCRFGFPKPISTITRILTHGDITQTKGSSYQCKRTEQSIFINNYNPTILRHWRANMDIQLINNAEGAAWYVCNYICTSEPDSLKLALNNLINDVFQANPDMHITKRLWKIGTCVLKHQRLSVQEAAFRLSSLHLLKTSRT